VVVDTGRSYTAEAASVGAPTLRPASDEDELLSGPVGCAADIVDDIPVSDERRLNVALKGPLTSVMSTQFSTAPTPSISVMLMGCGAIPLQPRLQRPSTTGNRSQTEAEQPGGVRAPVISNPDIGSAIVVRSGCGARSPYGLPAALPNPRLCHRRSRVKPLTPEGCVAPLREGHCLESRAAVMTR
jgi:hypothetical protein